MSSVNCPQCNVENRGGASFCDQCGAALAPSAVASETDSAGERQVNWPAIIFVIVLLAVVGWLLFGPSNGDAPVTGTLAVSGSNPHGGGTASTGDGESNAMGDLKLEESKTRLAENPLDTEALSNLYGVYRQIGRGAQIRVYLDAAITAMEDREAELGEDLQGLGIQLGMAAAEGDDFEGSLLVFEKILELRPDYHPIKRMLGDVCLTLSRFDQSVDWYSRYLEAADPATDGQDYWDTYHYRASTYLKWYESVPVAGRDIALMQSCLTDLEYITTNQPENTEAWFSLGNTYNLNGNIEAAITAWEHARDLSTNEVQRWTAESSIARARGEKIPPKPDSMAAGMGAMGSAETAGETQPPHGDDPNPHGGM